MDSFIYMSIAGRIEHYEKIARDMARESKRAVKTSKKAPARVKAPKLGGLVLVPEKRDA